MDAHLAELTLIVGEFSTSGCTNGGRFCEPAATVRTNGETVERQAESLDNVSDALREVGEAEPHQPLHASPSTRPTVRSTSQEV